jgi:hypothetical protein
MKKLTGFLIGILFVAFLTDSALAWKVKITNNMSTPVKFKVLSPDWFDAHVDCDYNPGIGNGETKICDTDLWCPAGWRVAYRNPNADNAWVFDTVSFGAQCWNRTLTLDKGAGGKMQIHDTWYQSIP